MVQRNHDAIITYLAAQDISSFVEVEDVVQCCNLDPSSLIYIRHLGARVRNDITLQNVVKGGIDRLYQLYVHIPHSSNQCTSAWS